MSDTSSTLDVRTFVAELQRSDEARLRSRLRQAANDGTLSSVVDPCELAEFVQTVWQGLSTRAELGASRGDLVGAANLAITFISELTDESARAAIRPAGR